jgi:hypothetical protein
MKTTHETQIVELSGTSSGETRTTSIRFPEAIYQEIVRRAREERRTITAQVLVMLESELGQMSDE